MNFRFRAMSDLLLAVFVVAITGMLLVPLPTVLIDLLIVLNLSLAFLLLLVGLYMPNALALLAFPSILLLTTLFRLSLNVASTRLILSQADAGRVIESFGTFLLRGEIAVGIIIFTIITIVNFIVIARGSSRVSEVAARFTLDALPGKQMALDADLRAGLITPEEAQHKREDLRKESQLYGSMDGAMKFVQGDAIAGFFIILTNLVGGCYIGVSQGLSFSEAANTYLVLTIGDGLVNQIPALLISICAGIVVTRVSSAEDSTLGADLSKQLFARPVAILVAGLLLLGLGLLPDLPFFPFAVIGTLFLLTSFLVRRSAQRARADLGITSLEGKGSSVGLLPGGLALERGIEHAPLVVALDGQVLFRLYRLNQSRHVAWWQEFSADFYAETGLRLPELVVAQDELAQASVAGILLHGLAVESHRIPLDAVMVEAHPESALVLGLEVIQEAAHPIDGSRVVWAANTPELRRLVEVAQLRSFDFLQFIGLRVAALATSMPEEFLSLTDVHTLLKATEKKHPGLISETLAQGVFTVPRLTEVVHELIRDGISVRDFRQIVEGMAAYSAGSAASTSDTNDFDRNEVVSFVRLSRKRHLLARRLSPRQTLKVIVMDESVQAELENIPTSSSREMPVVDPAVFDRLSASLQSLVEPVRTRGVLPLTLLCSPDQRAAGAALVRTMQLPVQVMSTQELEARVQVELAGVWAV